MKCGKHRSALDIACPPNDRERVHSLELGNVWEFLEHFGSFCGELLLGIQLIEIATAPSA